LAVSASHKCLKKFILLSSLQALIVYTPTHDYHYLLEVINLRDLFSKRLIESELRNPTEDFNLEKQKIEYRKELLTSRACRINVKRSERKKQAQTGMGYSELIELSTKNCYFCPANIKTATPMFPSSLVPEGRIKLGETTVFPNLFPFAKYHAVATISRQHFLGIDEFTLKQIQDTIKASIEYFRAVKSNDKKAVYPIFSWNFLPPAGASVVHPHVQLTVDEQPTNLAWLYLSACKSYFKKHKENYWQRLLEIEEKEGDRFLGKIGGVSWITSYVPLGNDEICGVSHDVSSLYDLDDTSISDLSKGLKRVFTAYTLYGVHSFNLSTFSAASRDESFRLVVRIIARPYPQSYYNNDAGFMERLHEEVIVESMPEKVASDLKEYFG
jgi:UDPglucose--hexose-1-phosphate uridylyltransferase